MINDSLLAMISSTSCPSMNAADRPRIHLTPPVGWLNDPNGIAFRDGLAHAFFQFEPDVPRWGLMRWGHAVSRDLLTWKHLPIALEPGGRRTRQRRLLVRLSRRPGGAWRADHLLHGRHPRRRDPAGIDLLGDGRSRADRLDEGAGRPGHHRPAIGDPARHFPRPVRLARRPGWAMLIGAGTTAGRGARPALSLRRPAAVAVRRSVPDDGGAHRVSCPDLDVAEVDSSCWECPQLGDDRRDGRADPVDRRPLAGRASCPRCRGQRTPSSVIASSRRGLKRLGLGPDFYAPSITTTPDGRVLMLGWIPEDPPGTANIAIVGRRHDPPARGLGRRLTGGR